MMCISLWQPWATLCVLGIKCNETRHWATKHRGPLLIHAAKKPVVGYALDLHKDLMTRFNVKTGILAYGAIVGQVELVNCREVELVRDHLLERELLCGNYGDGRFAWLFHSPKKFERPIPCRGFQRMWNVDEALLGART